MKEPNSQQWPRQARNPLEWMRWVPLALLVLVFCAAVIIGARIILVPMLCSLALAYLLAPVVAWFERRGWSRSSSVLLTISAATVTLALILIFILPGLWGQLVKTYNQVGELLGNQSPITSLLEKVKQISPRIYEFLKSKIDKSGESDLLNRAFSMAGQWLQKGLFGLVDVTASMLDLLLIPFFVYYLLADYRAMRARLDMLIPPRHRAVAATLISRINYVISSYVRNQLAIALMMGVLYSIGFAIARVPLAFSIGMLSGLLNFIPYLGTLTGLTLSLSFVALDGGGVARILGVVVVFILVQSVEGYYLTPKLLGGSLDLHPMWVLVGLMIAGSLFGILGIILVVPVIAIAKVALDFLEDLYQQSDFYRNSGLELVTEQGLSDRPRRTIITTSELQSRIKDGASYSENRED
ncbi:MAG TPA: AI-2E family transporter [Blastocatellia bacterium]|nr:AI-2E family transporter [Blastocatellia bacterium]